MTLFANRIVGASLRRGRESVRAHVPTPLLYPVEGMRTVPNGTYVSIESSWTTTGGSAGTADAANPAYAGSAP
jgi:hypothetical protein